MSPEKPFNYSGAFGNDSGYDNVGVDLAAETPVEEEPVDEATDEAVETVEEEVVQEITYETLYDEPVIFANEETVEETPLDDESIEEDEPIEEVVVEDEPAEEVASPAYAYPNVDGGKLRVRATPDGDIVAHAYKRTRLEVLDDSQPDWALVQFDDDGQTVVGYVKKSFLVEA